MISFASLPMSLKTTISALFFITLSAGICACIFVGSKQGRQTQALLPACTSVVGAMLLLFASVIDAERAKPIIPDVSLWFSRLPVLFPLLVWLIIALFLAMVILKEYRRRQSAVTPSSIKESLDHLQTGLCFSYPNGQVLLTNHQMNSLSHLLLGEPLQNANLFWKALSEGEIKKDVQRLSDGDHPEFRLADGRILSFQKETLSSIIQITAADTTHQHRLLENLQEKNLELEEMNERIRHYGSKVDAYVIVREQLETRVNLHGFLGQALLMTRHYLQNENGDPQKILDIWQRNIDVLRLEARPQKTEDSLSSLKNAAAAIGMQVHVSGPLPRDTQIQKLIAALGAETLTNAVRHAGAKQLWIDVEESQDEYVVRYTNDGAAPSGPINADGGLENARRKVEAVGGRMQISSAPRFMLTVFFVKEVRMDV